MFRALGAVLAAGLVLAAVQVPATADTRAPTRFSEFSVTPTSLDVDHPTVTYTGRLVSTGADGADQGVPGARVCLAKDLRCVATTDTDADGRFTSPVTLSATGDQPQLRDGMATAFFNGDKDNQSTDVRQGIALQVTTQVQTRITIGFDHKPDTPTPPRSRTRAACPPSTARWSPGSTPHPSRSARVPSSQRAAGSCG